MAYGYTLDSRQFTALRTNISIPIALVQGGITTRQIEEFGGSEQTP